MGDGPRGLQHRRRRVVVLHPRPGPLARLPLGRGRAGRADATSTSGCASRWRCGTSRTRSSRSACSASPTPRATTARTSRSTTSTSTTCRRTATSAGSTSTRRRRTRTTTSSPRTGARSRDEIEYELLDTGVFDDDRYFDVEVVYAKASEHDVLCRITVTNRGPDDAPIHLVADAVVPQHVVVPPAHRRSRRCGRCRATARRRRRAPRARRRGTSTRPTTPTLLFCDNESNAARLWGATDSPPFPKDGIADHVVHGTADGEPGPGRAPRPRPTCASSCRPAASDGGTWLRLRRRQRRCDDPFGDAADVVADAARRGRRVLRRDHARPRRRRRRVGDAPGAGRDAVVEAVVLLRPRRVVARAPVPPAAQPRQRRRATRRGSTC